jgi:hypothetical protein
MESARRVSGAGLVSMGPWRRLEKVAAGLAHLEGGGNVPNWEIGEKGTAAQHIVVYGGDYYQRLENRS